MHIKTFILGFVVGLLAPFSAAVAAFLIVGEDTFCKKILDPTINMSIRTSKTYK